MFLTKFSAFIIAIFAISAAAGEGGISPPCGSCDSCCGLCVIDTCVGLCSPPFCPVDATALEAAGEGRISSPCGSCDSCCGVCVLDICVGLCSPPFCPFDGAALEADPNEKSGCWLGYDQVTIHNHLKVDVSGSVVMDACDNVPYHVPAGGSWTQPHCRGFCLVGSITGIEKGGVHVKSYHTSGTSYSLFFVEENTAGQSYICSSHDCL